MLKEMQEALIAGKKADVESLVDQALAAGIPAGNDPERGADPRDGTSRRAVQEQRGLYPRGPGRRPGHERRDCPSSNPILAKAGIQPKGIVVIGTVKGDLHDIGKNLVAMMLRGNGYKIVDLGVDVSGGEIPRSGQDERGQRHRPVRPADDDHGPDEGRHRGRREGRTRGSRRHRRSPRHPRLRRPDPRPRLCSRRGLGRRGDRTAYRLGMTSRGLAVDSFEFRSPAGRGPRGRAGPIRNVI